MKASCHPDRRVLFSPRYARKWERGLCAPCVAAARVRLTREQRGLKRSKPSGPQRVRGAWNAAAGRGPGARFERMPAAEYMKMVVLRARRLGGSFGVPVDQWVAIIESTDGQCVYCSRRSGRLSISYLVPISRGGPDRAENVLPACPRCIHCKGKRLITEWPAAKALLLPSVLEALARRSAALKV